MRLKLKNKKKEQQEYCTYFNFSYSTLSARDQVSILVRVDAVQLVSQFNPRTAQVRLVVMYEYMDTQSMERRCSAPSIILNSS